LQPARGGVSFQGRNEAQLRGYPMKIEFVLYRYLNGGNVMINQNGVSSYTVFDSFEAARGG
jgi:hypothetical protein